jgi:hypothetical protein
MHSKTFLTTFFETIEDDPQDATVTTRGGSLTATPAPDRSYIHCNSERRVCLSIIAMCTILWLLV